jgi:hypothetical protein
MRQPQFATGITETTSVVELMHRFDERTVRMNDGTMASKIAKLRVMMGQVPRPPIAGESF